jgi:hypothetical protein
MRHRTIVSPFFTATLLIAALVSTGQKAQAAPAEDSREVTQLLEDAMSQVADLQRDSDELESFTRSNLSWQSHADELTRIGDRINTLGKTLEKLESMRSSASPWQREAMDRIVPLAKKLASNTTAAIEHLNKNPTHLNDPQYQQYLKSNAEVARNLSSLVKDFVEYGKTKSTMESLESRLEVNK